MKIYVLLKASGFTSETYVELFKDKEKAVEAFTELLDAFLEDKDWDVAISEQDWEGKISSIEWEEYSARFKTMDEVEAVRLSEELKAEYREACLKDLSFRYDDMNDNVINKITVEEQDIKEV